MRSFVLKSEVVGFVFLLSGLTGVYFVLLMAGVNSVVISGLIYSWERGKVAIPAGVVVWKPLSVAAP
ncbi:hypothetical protein [Ralstonia solanacearum]|uniref:hypothetical protein n=1 Tax=Ralstonia solanacearum TaxID=305 RepID=UPI0023493AED|nr:hypothetical protein [Ralstonia solanacearum]MDC6210280.1 hypothetical protein [Ralstonia solanacearum]